MSPHDQRPEWMEHRDTGERFAPAPPSLTATVEAATATGLLVRVEWTRPSGFGAGIRTIRLGNPSRLPFAVVMDRPHDTHPTRLYAVPRPGAPDAERAAPDWRARLARNLARPSTGRWERLTEPTPPRLARVMWWGYSAEGEPLAYDAVDVPPVAVEDFPGVRASLETVARSAAQAGEMARQFRAAAVGPVAEAMRRIRDRIDPATGRLRPDGR